MDVHFDFSIGIIWMLISFANGEGAEQIFDQSYDCKYWMPYHEWGLFFAASYR